jgi:hypothetical protein
MARPQKQTVDYFPHYCNHGKTMFILESRFGNNGYTFWFKLLETLGNKEGHVLNLTNEDELEFLSAKTRVSVTETIAILDLLAKLGAIDPQLWSKKIVWCQKFVDNLFAIYDKRTVSAPVKPVSGPDNPVSVVGNPQSRVDKSKHTVPNGTESKKTTMEYTEPVIQLDEDGEEITPTQPHSGKYGKYTRLVAQHYADKHDKIVTGQTMGEAKKLLSFIHGEFPKDDNASLAKEAIAAINLTEKFYSDKKLTWGLLKVIENWKKL